VTETAALPPLKLPELLAPAGDWDCVRAAVENGADSIYFGLDRFNARMRAQNFTEADLPALMEFLHRRGVRGYVTFNTLVFTDELADAEDYLRSVISAGVDAAIVQDVGICRLIRKISPDFPIHGSTQLTVTSPAAWISPARWDASWWFWPARILSAKSRPSSRPSVIKSPSLEAHRPFPWKCSFTGRCAWPTPANASRANPSAAAAPTAVNAPRPAACPTNWCPTGKP
jgi:hypothetical protein